MANISSIYDGNSAAKRYLSPGVDVMNVSTEMDHRSDTVRVMVELRVSAYAGDDAMRHVLENLRDVITAPRDDTPHDSGLVDEPDADAPDVMLRELRAHLDERLDDIDRALRLAVDP